MKNTLVPQLKPLYKAKLHKNIRELIDYAAYRYADDDAFIVKEKKAAHGEPAVYRHITYAEMKRDIIYLGTAFKNRGLLGKHIAIIGKNRYEWMISHYAVQCGNGVSVPLDKGLPLEELENSLILSEAEVLIFDKDHLELAKRVKFFQRTRVSLFICMDDIPGFDSISQLIREGGDAIYDGDNSYTRLPIDEHAVSMLVFTSGTTSMAKAVMLTQYNITTNCYALELEEDLHHGDVNMAFLPYHHTFGSTGQTLCIGLGCTTVFCDGLKYIQKNIQEYGVSVFICVPLLIEAMYKKIMAGIRKQGKQEDFEKGVRITGLLNKLHIDIRRRVFKDIHEQLGGHLRSIVSGASALDPEVVEGFEAIGITVVQGYGMTEASPVIVAENPKTRKPGSIGHALYGVQVVIYDQDEEGVGELICRGPNVMKGYYHNQEATDEAIIDGWLHTGDLAVVDKQGFVFLKGRKKSVIVLKNGKNVYPEELEDLIDALPYTAESMVYGQKRRKDGDSKDLIISARIVVDPDTLEQSGGIEVMQQTVQADIDGINKTLPSYKQIHRIELTDEPMEKTTTGKIKRYAQKE